MRSNWLIIVAANALSLTLRFSGVQLPALHRNRFTRIVHTPKVLNHWRRVAKAFILLYRRLPVGSLLESAKALQVKNLRYGRLESLRNVARSEICGFGGFSHPVETAGAVLKAPKRTITPLKQGVNETSWIRVQMITN